MLQTDHKPQSTTQTNTRNKPNKARTHINTKKLKEGVQRIKERMNMKTPEMIYR